MRPGKGLSRSTWTSIAILNAAKTGGARAPQPAPYIKGSSPMMGPFLTLPEPARTSPQQPPCCMAFRRPRRPRIAALTGRFARCSSEQRRSRRKVRCLDDANPTPASEHLRCIPPRMHPYTKHRRPAGSPPLSLYINASAVAVTYVASSTLGDVPKGDEGEAARRGYHPRRGGRYDSNEDRSPSPVLPGPQAFGRHILNAAFPLRYRPPTNIPKYSGETNPGLWLEDYRLACQAGGASDDNFIIRNLPLFLTDST